MGVERLWSLSDKKDEGGKGRKSEELGAYVPSEISFTTLETLSGRPVPVGVPSKKNCIPSWAGWKRLDQGLWKGVEGKGFRDGLQQWGGRLQMDELAGEWEVRAEMIVVDSGMDRSWSCHVG